MHAATKDRSVHPASARRALTALLVAAGWGHDAVDDAVLVVSELVTNAMRHGGGVRRVAVVVDRRTLLFEVHDGSDELPSTPTKTPTETPGEQGGRGLAIVDALSDDWGVEHESGGKRVWFRLTR